MRNLIVGLSVIFFALSGIILFKALNIPVNHGQRQNNQEGLKTEDFKVAADDPAGKPPPGPAVSQPAVRNLQDAAVPSGEEGLIKTSLPDEIDKTSGTGNKAGVLAVIGAGAFNSGQIVIDDSLMNTIKEVIPNILSSPGYRVYVEGHTDDMPIKASPDKRYVDNMELSFLRAKAIASILVENGISRDRISVSGYGETRPIASNDTEEGRIKNRRVEIKLVPDEKEL